MKTTFAPRHASPMRRIAISIVLLLSACSGSGDLLAGTGRSPADDPTVPPSPMPSIGEELPPTTIVWESIPGTGIGGDAVIDIRTGDVTALPSSITSFGDPGGYAVASGGDALLFEARADGSKRKQIFVANVDGSNVRQLTDAPGGADAGGWSPDGTKIVARTWGPEGPGTHGGQVDLVLIDVATGEAIELASGPDHAFFEPHFSADGRQVLFSRYTKPQGSDLFGVPIDGGDVALVFEERWDAIFSPDGRTLLYEVSVCIPQDAPFSGGCSTGQELWLGDADGRRPRPLVLEEAFNDDPSWSPDGERIVYGRTVFSWELGKYVEERVVVIDVNDGAPLFSVSTPEGETPIGVWLDDDTVLVDI